MERRDLGEINGSLLVFGGPYSNVQALRALLTAGAGLGIPADRMICSGDIVAYGADPMACVDLVRDAGMAVVAGNVERQLALGALDCGCGFEEGSTCDLLSAGWYGFANAAVGSDARRWMRDLPDVITLTHCGRRIAILHGGISDVSRFLWPVSAEQDFAEEIALLGDVDLVIAGHCGLAFQRRIGRVDWINAGVIGMPPNDGGRDTQYLVVRDGQAEVRALRYDATAAHAAMVRAGLVQRYHAALLSGHWPSEDVLPHELRRDQSFASG